MSRLVESVTSNRAIGQPGVGHTRRLRLAAVVAAAVAFAVSWHLGVFLVIAVLPAAALTMLAHDRVVDRCDGGRAAALAIAAPEGIAEPAAIERIIAADLSATALGDEGILDGAINRASRTIDDPWQRALALERLEAAKTFLAEVNLVRGGTFPILGSRTAHIVAGSCTALAVTGALITGQEWLLAPHVLAFAALGMTHAQLRRSHHLQVLLVSQATAPPANAAVVIREAAVTSAIGDLTAGRPRVRRCARALITRWPGPERERANRRLDVVPSPRVHLSRIDRDVLVFTVAAAAATAVIEIV